MKKFAILLAISLLASAAFALVDDGTSSLGVYFDNTGDTNCFTPTPATPFNVYMILANPEVANMGGYEFAWRLNPEPVPAPFILGLTLPPQALNIGTNYNLIVGLGGGLVTTEATVLATFNMMVLGAVTADIQVGPATPASIPGHAAYNDFNDPAHLIPMNFSTVDGVDVVIDANGWVVPGVASMPCPGPVATDQQTWGTVKALFQ